MADSTVGTGMDGLVAGQNYPHITVNEALDALSQGATFGRRGSSSNGLTWGYYGGNVVLLDGAVATLPHGTVTLAASATNYIVASRTTGAVSASTSTTNWNDAQGYWQLYAVVTGASGVTSFTDERAHARFQGGQTFSAPVIPDGASNRDISATDAGAYIRMTNVSPKTATFRPNATHALPSASEFHFRCVGGSLTLTAGVGVTLNAPSGGTLVLSAGMTVTVKRVAVDEFDVIGHTVPA